MLLDKYLSYDVKIWIAVVCEAFGYTLEHPTAIL